MAEFKNGDRVLVPAAYREMGATFCEIQVGDVVYNFFPDDVRPYTDPDAANPLDAAVAELGRVTGLSGDDLLTAAKRAILSAAQRIIVAGVDLRVAREEAMDDIRRAIGEAPPSVLEHAAALPPDDNTDDTPF